MDYKLKLMRRLTRRLPRIRGAGALANLLRLFYLRRKRASVEINTLGFKMKLDPSECVDSGLLFYPHIYDHHEIAFVKRNLRPGDTFLDGGANIGFYSLIASKMVGTNGFVDVSPELYPKFILVEHNPEYTSTGKEKGDAIKLLENKGYKIYGAFSMNYIMTL